MATASRWLSTGARWLQRALALAAVACFLALAVLPRAGWYQTWTVLSPSMAPALPAGSVAVVVPRPASALRTGDILVYRPPSADAPLAHRVVALEAAPAGVVIRTKGDANSEADPWRARLEGDTAWIAVGVVPGAGFALKWLQGDTVRLIGLYGLPLLFVLAVLGSIWRPRAARPEEIAAQASQPTRRPRAPLPASAPGWYIRALAGVAAGTDRPWLENTGQYPAPRRGGRALRRTVLTATLALAATTAVAVPSAAVLADSTSASHGLSTAALAAPGPLGATQGCSALPLPQQFFADLSWSQPADTATTGYRIERSINGGAFSLLTTIGARATVTHRDEGLGPSTTYAYRVQSTRGNWTSAFTGPTSITTPAACA